jgi:hypothetical protein
MDPMKEKMKRAYDTFAGLVYRFYNTKFVDNIIFGAPKDGRFRDGVISVLAGDVYREDNPFQEMLLQSKRHSIRTAPLPTAPSETTENTQPPETALTTEKSRAGAR